VMLEFSVLAGRATAIRASDPAGERTFRRMRESGIGNRE
jgi:hypothetical protein